MSSYRERAEPMLILAFGNHVIGMDAETGERVWEHEVAHREPMRLLVDRDRVLVLSRDDLLALDYATGTLLWNTGVPLAVAGPSATLLVQAGKVFCAGGGEVAAFSREDGAKLWHDGFKGYGIHAVALAAPGTAAQIDRRG